MTTPPPHLLQEMANVFTNIPFNKILGLKVTQMDAECVIATFEMRNDLIGNFLHNILHGGVVSSVLDTLGGMAVMTAVLFKHPEYTLEQLGEMFGKSSTVDLQVSYLRPGKGEHFIAKAWVTKSGSKISFVRMELYNNESVLIATGSGTYFIR